MVAGALASESMEIDGNGAPEHLELAELARNGVHLVPIVEVAFRNDMWWAIPQELSRELVARRAANENAVYCWDWGEQGRRGSYAPEGETTSLNRYIVDFELMRQRNLDNGRERSIRIVYICNEDVMPSRTGQLPEQ